MWVLGTEPSLKLLLHFIGKEIPDRGMDLSQAN